MTSFSDDFNRADGALGANWTDITSTFDIVSNKAAPHTAAVCHSKYTGTACATDDNFAQVTYSTLSAGSSFGVGCRFASGATETGYFARWTTTAVQIFKVVAGANTALGSSASDSIAPGDVLRITAVGTTITGYRNGVQKVQVTDSAIASGKYTTIRGGSTTAMRLDDFSGGDLGVTVDATASLTATATLTAAADVSSGAAASLTAAAALTTAAVATRFVAAALTATATLTGVVPAEGLYDESTVLYDDPSMLYRGATASGPITATATATFAGGADATAIHPVQGTATVTFAASATATALKPVSATTAATFAAVAVTGLTYGGAGTGSVLFGASADAQILDASSPFAPPPDTVRLRTRLWWVEDREGVSLLKVDGVWQRRRSPSQDTLAQLVEGETYFRGGYQYEHVPASIKNELIASGLASEEDFS